jgi:hypothetical protein
LHRVIKNSPDGKVTKRDVLVAKNYVHEQHKVL